jgi:hypothetical protein
MIEWALNTIKLSGGVIYVVVKIVSGVPQAMIALPRMTKPIWDFITDRAPVTFGDFIEKN